jgi:hypothetical protein
MFWCGAEKECGASYSPRSGVVVLDGYGKGWLSSEAARLHMEGFSFRLATILSHKHSRHMSSSMSSLTRRGEVNVWDDQGNVHCRRSMIAQYPTPNVESEYWQTR